MNDNGLPVIDSGKCTGCGACVAACPRNIIELIPENFDVYVLCRNKEKASIVKQGCSVGCIGCKRCEKACTEVFSSKPEAGTAIKVDNFLAAIDYSKCINCYKCAEVCPVPVISPLERAVKKPKAAAGPVEAAGA
jgi:ferredoxin